MSDTLLIGLLAVSAVNVAVAAMLVPITIWTSRNATSPWTRKTTSHLTVTTVTFLFFRLILQALVAVAAALLYCSVIPREQRHAIITSGMIASVIIDWIRQAEALVPLNRRGFLLIPFSLIYSVLLVPDLVLLQWPQLGLLLVCSLHRVLIAVAFLLGLLFIRRSTGIAGSSRGAVVWSPWVVGNLLGAVLEWIGVVLSPSACRLFLYGLSSAFEIAVVLRLAIRCVRSSRDQISDRIDPDAQGPITLEELLREGKL